MGRKIIDRNDRVAWDPDDKRTWPDSLDVVNAVELDESYQGADCLIQLNDPKGGDPLEWPEDLRIREWPLNKAEALVFAAHIVALADDDNQFDNVLAAVENT